jgi:hypothetical protein
MSSIRTLSATKRSDTSREVPVYGTDDGALDVNIRSNYAGLASNTLYAEQSGVGAGADNDLVLTTADVSAYNTHVFALTVGTADIELSINGTTWTDSATAPIFLRELSAESTTPGIYDLVNVMATGKVYMLQAKVKKLRVRSASAAATACHMASYVG